MHALFSPSSAHRWMNCPASLALESVEPGSTSKYAEEGTRAHEYAAAELTNPADALLVDAVYTPDMRDYVDQYVKGVREAAGGNHLLVEQRIDFSRWVNMPEQFGTADAIVIDDRQSELQIHDLKYGMGVAVDAEHNPQLMIYGLGAMDRYGVLGDFERFRFCIHQPRLYRTSEWICTREELLAFGEELTEAAYRAEHVLQNFNNGALPRGDAYAPSEKTCKFCKAKATCPALGAFVAAAVSDDFESLPESKTEALANATRDKDFTTEFFINPKALFYEKEVARLAEARNRVPLIQDWCSAVVAKVEALARGGTPVPGWKVVLGNEGNRQWRDEKEAEAMLKAQRFKAEQIYTRKLISAPQTEKLFKDKPRVWSKMQELIVRAPAKPVVVPATDRRPAVSISPAHEDFAIEEGLL